MTRVATIRAPSLAAPTPAPGLVVARRGRARVPVRALTCSLACSLAVAALAGCASVPEVESRLQTLQFHPNMYVVQAGDTLETIAFRYELTPTELAALNPGSEQGLTPGQRINVRPGTELSEAVRARAVTPAAPAPEREVAAAYAGEPLTPAPPAARPVVVAPAPTPPGAVAAVPVPEPGGGWPREEIVPDDLDAAGVARADAPLPAGDAAVGSRRALDAQLQGYVGEWTWPTDGAVARGFAPERIGGQGVDIAGVPGQDVRAALDGTVVYSGRDLSGGGNLVIVRHGDDLMTTYSHADALFVTEDDRVSAGDPIASLGWNSERESVLRFEVRRDGNPLDPMAFLPPR